MLRILLAIGLPPRLRGVGAPGDAFGSVLRVDKKVPESPDYNPPKNHLVSIGVDQIH